MPGNGRGPVKVVIINTQYVETDARSFKSVVQKLTGKDSVIANGHAEDNNIVAVGPERGINGFKRPNHQMPRMNNVLDRNWSIRDIDRLLKEMPPVDELAQLWDY